MNIFNRELHSVFDGDYYYPTGITLYDLWIQNIEYNCGVVSLNSEGGDVIKYRSFLLCGGRRTKKYPKLGARFRKYEVIEIIGKENYSTYFVIDSRPRQNEIFIKNYNFKNVLIGLATIYGGGVNNIIYLPKGSVHNDPDAYLHYIKDTPTHKKGEEVKLNITHGYSTPFYFNYNDDEIYEIDNSKTMVRRHVSSMAMAVMVEVSNSNKVQDKIDELNSNSVKD